MTSRHSTNRGRQKLPALVKSVVLGFKDSHVSVLSDIPDNELWIPSSNHALNYVMGHPKYGAFPQGKIIEIYGPRMSAKSAILYDAAVQCQKLGGVFVWIDAENALHKPYIKYLGLDLKNTIYIAAIELEGVLDRIKLTIDKLRNKKFSGPILIGVDSIASLKTKRELKHDYAEEKSDMGHKAGVLSKSMSDIADTLKDSTSTMIVLNQIRKKVGVVFGNPEYRPGGEAIPFYASQCISVRKGKKIRKKKRDIGSEIAVYGEKNKVRPPFGRATINVWSDRIGRNYGIDQCSGLIEVLERDEIITKVRGNSASFMLIDKPEVRFTSVTIHKYIDNILDAIPDNIYLQDEEPKSRKLKVRKRGKKK